MGDDAVDIVRSGQVDPVLAAEVASRVTDPAEQVTIMRDLIAQKPQTADMAAQIVSEAMDRRALPDSLERLLGADKPIRVDADTAPVAEPPEVRAARELYGEPAFEPDTGATAAPSGGERRSDTSYLGEPKASEQRATGGGHIELSEHEPGGILDFINRDEPLSSQRADFLADLIEACRV